jgi:hypothetical protein
MGNDVCVSSLQLQTEVVDSFKTSTSMPVKAETFNL